MLRPEQMSKVSVTGSKAVMDDVIEAIHDLNLLHLSDYDGSWEGFGNGDPIEGADEASEKLITVRSLESILNVDEEEAGPSRIVTDDALESELEEIRTEANELDDRLGRIEDDLRAVEEEIDSIEPFAALGIELDLLSGYDNLTVAVGEGDESDVAAALDATEGIEEYETFSGDGVVAVFAYPADDSDEDTVGETPTSDQNSSSSDNALDDALVGVDFAQIEVPDAEGSPEEYVEELRHEKQQLESQRATVEGELEELRLDAAGFLLAAEEKLSIEVQKTEAPLQFATTANSFIAEGWIPTDRYGDLERALDDAVGDRVDVEELERADYDQHEHGAQPSQHEQEKVADGGTTMDDEPPVVQDNPGTIKPFELLVETINRPKYSEFDPTVILFLTFPAFFGFMIGDLGYGILYMGIGYWLYSSFDSDAIRSLGGIALWAGIFTSLFGVLYGEIFGLHELGEIVWNGNPPMHKGLQPAELAYAQTWLVVSLLVGLAHMTLGYVFDFLKEVGHSLTDAVLESGSWASLMIGVWLWIFSTQKAGQKPDFLFEIFSGHPFSLGFSGFSSAVGSVGLALAAVGFVLVIAGEVKHLGGPGLLAGALESLSVLSEVISYTRIAAVLLAKAGMAFVVNLLFFGAYAVPGEHGGGEEFHFMLNHGAEYVTEHHAEATILFPGLMHSGVAGLIGGLLVLVLGHLLVLALGITSAGLQAVRLEYVEFFGKFYDGGGEKYEPFGYDRSYTTED